MQLVEATTNYETAAQLHINNSIEKNNCDINSELSVNTTSKLNKLTIVKTVELSDVNCEISVHSEVTSQLNKSINKKPAKKICGESEQQSRDNSTSKIAKNITKKATKKKITSPIIKCQRQCKTDSTN